MRNKILIVDDSFINRELLTEMLEDEYEVITCENGLQALELMEENYNELAIILLDLVMPVLDGVGFLKALQNKPIMKDIPILVISGETNVETEIKCFDYGVFDFIKKPFDNRLVKKRIKNAVDLYMYKNNLEERVAEQTSVISEQYNLLKHQADQLAKSNVSIIEILGTIVEYRNLESGEHIQRVKSYTRILGEQLMEDYPEYNLTSKQLNVIVSASALHDVGKIAIPDSILLKPGRLTKEEFEYMKEHTTKGCEIINNIRGVWSEEYAKASYEICRHHHERYDGRGYPDGILGENIPISAQLVAVADVYDALVNERVYKSAFSADKAFNMIINGECGTFSPKLMDCFTKCRDRFESLAGER
ncbi:MAG: HD domain-containing phosphohydrolase [Lachnospiraceae bacterium]